MPLSEEEQRLLEQMEEALAAEDPKLVSTLRGSTSRLRHKRIAILSTLGFVAGVAILMTGAITTLTFVAVGGFVVMLACAMWALTSWRHMGGVATGHSTGPSRGQSGARSQRRGRKADKDRRGRAGRAGFMERLEERWRRRQEGGR